MEDIKKIAAGWISYTSLEDESPWKRNYEWAYDAVEDLIDSHVEAAWELILLLTNMADSDHLIANLAAGPLETLISRHGAELINLIEAEARENKKFHNLLGGVWRNDIPEDIWVRIDSINKSKW